MGCWALWKVVSPLIPSDSGDAVHADTIARLATLLTAGLAPVSAWRELADNSTDEVCSRVMALVDQGRNIHDAVAEVTTEESVAWRSVGACWSVARRSGSAIGPALMALAESLNDVASTKREIAVALASPLATIRLVMVLPVVAVISSLLSGVGEAHTVFLTPVGFGALVLGGVMMAVAWWWSKRLAEGVQPPESAFSLELDLFAVACSGGALPEAARRTVEQVMKEYQLEPAPNEEVKNLQALSRRAGVPVIKLATAHATLLRRRMRTHAQEKVERLGVALVMPLGLLVLPAFVLIAVVPMALGLWGTGISTT
jgi:tight adherence protein B